MDLPNERRLPERNPKTHAEHRREVFWQITLPLVVGILLVLTAIAAIVFFATQPAPELNRWAGVSLIWLILPSLFIALIFLVILIAFIFAITMLLRLTPRYAQVIQSYFEIGAAKVRQIANFLTEPILKINSFLAVLQHIVRWGRKPVDEG